MDEQRRYDIGSILNYILPNCAYYGVQWGKEEDYNNIQWFDSRNKPSWEDIVDIEEKYTFEKTKADKINQIDYNTKNLFNQGFIFQNTTFSMSSNAISKIQNLQLAILRKSEFTQILCNDALNGTLFIVTPDNAQQYIDAFSTRYLYLLQSDAQMKESIRLLNTIEELNNFIDSRE